MAASKIIENPAAKRKPPQQPDQSTRQKKGVAYNTHKGGANMRVSLGPEDFVTQSPVMPVAPEERPFAS